MIVATKNPGRGLKIHMCCAVEDQEQEPRLYATPTIWIFNLDSFTIGIYNHASACMLGNPDHFLGPIIPMKRHRVKVIGGKLVEVKAKVTPQWKIADNNGQVNLLLIKNALLFPGIPYFLLSPQHWRQKAQDNRPIRRSTQCATYADACELQWKQCQFARTLNFYPSTNVAKIQSPTGSMHSCVFVANLD